MKIAILTWCTYCNCGTFLQAYALKEFLKEEGFEVDLLDDVNIVNWSPSYKLINGNVLHEYLRIIRHPRYLINLIQRKYTAEAFLSFKKEKLVPIKFDDLKSIDNKYNCYICGSDQIWNPITFNGLTENYFFASFSNKKKIAYAPSLGVSELPFYLVPRYKELLESFNFLSARELEGRRIMENLVGKCVTDVLDPTLLFHANQWDDLLDLREEKFGEYIYAYFLTYNQKYIDNVKLYAKRHNLKLIMSFSYDNSANLQKCVGVGPSAFVKYIKNAKIVITDSFHATVFSVIYSKNFITLKRFNDLDKMNQNSRIINFLTMIGLLDRWSEGDNLFNKFKEIDYRVVLEKLQNEIDKSKNFLKNSLK